MKEVAVVTTRSPARVEQGTRTPTVPGINTSYPQTFYTCWGQKMPGTVAIPKLVPILWITLVNRGWTVRIDSVPSGAWAKPAVGPALARDLGRGVAHPCLTVIPGVVYR